MLHRDKWKQNRETDKNIPVYRLTLGMHSVVSVFVTEVRNYGEEETFCLRVSKHAFLFQPSV